ncbi:nicotinate-nucleotide--dimethylbenzimidazole phosphoribosyltransferase [Streptomyces sp. MS06]|uniref:nicotinate-nucleotide--dimethylbenzimidazole phosphoribosyltransferase n=1 Tax=Streptomyces sp. MS06 TaxID=3385974 RepID=UPI0039A1F519
MTDTGQVPGEGLPENAGTVEQPGEPGAYTYLSETTAEDEDLLLPGSGGAWGHEVAPPAPEPVLETLHEPGPHELSGRDSGSVDLGGVRLPNQAPPAAPVPPAAPRRPLHLGPPTPDTSSSPVRSLADRGPAGAPVRQPAPQAAGPEYLDVPTVHEATPQPGVPWGAPGAPAAAPAAEAVAPVPPLPAAPQAEPAGAAQAAVARLTTEAAAAAGRPATGTAAGHPAPVPGTAAGTAAGQDFAADSDPAAGAPGAASQGPATGEARTAPVGEDPPADGVRQAPEAAAEAGIPEPGSGPGTGDPRPAAPAPAAPGGTVTGNTPAGGGDAPEPAAAATGPVPQDAAPSAPEAAPEAGAAAEQTVDAAPDATPEASAEPVPAQAPPTVGGTAEAPAAEASAPREPSPATPVDQQPEAGTAGQNPPHPAPGPAPAGADASDTAPGAGPAPEPGAEAAPRARHAAAAAPGPGTAVPGAEPVPGTADPAPAEDAPGSAPAAAESAEAPSPQQPVPVAAPEAAAPAPSVPAPADAVAEAAAAAGPETSLPGAPPADDPAAHPAPEAQTSPGAAEAPVAATDTETRPAEQPAAGETGQPGTPAVPDAVASAVSEPEPEAALAAAAPEAPGPEAAGEHRADPAPSAGTPSGTAAAAPYPPGTEPGAEAAQTGLPAGPHAPAAEAEPAHAAVHPGADAAAAGTSTEASGAESAHPPVTASQQPAQSTGQPPADARPVPTGAPAGSADPVAAQAPAPDAQPPAGGPVTEPPAPQMPAPGVQDPQPTGPESTGPQPTGAQPTGAQPTGAQPTGPESTGPQATAPQPTGPELQDQSAPAPAPAPEPETVSGPQAAAPAGAAVPAPREAAPAAVHNGADVPTTAADQEDRADRADRAEGPAQEGRDGSEAEDAAAAGDAPESAQVPVPAGPAAPGYDAAEREAVLKVMRERRDIRNGFRKDPIPHEVLLRVLEAAHTAPSVGHSQPWDFVVIRSAETRRAMHELAVRQREAYAKSLPKGRAKQFKELKIEAILDTPVNIVVTADPTRGGRHTLGRHTQPQMAPYSAALAVENLWLAARAEGLGVGWVSFFDEREMVRALGLPEHLEVIAYLCVGYVNEFPDEPELMQAGWSKRRPLSWVVHEETYGRRALPGEEPHDLLAETVAQIRPLDAKALGEAWERQKRMTKPAGALGMLEIISAQLSGLSRQCPPPVPEPAAVAIFAGDHGVHAQGVTPWPQEVTAQMVANFLGGGAVCNAFAGQVGAEVCIVDVGVAADLPATPGLLPRKIRAGTSDMTAGPAMTREEAKQAVEVGIETARDLVAAGNRALLTGEMGIANTTASAALISVFTGADPAEVTGRGTGINDETLARKTEVVRRALEVHRPDPADPLGALAAVGGFEHAAMVGLLLGGASLRTPVILDGVSAGAAALVARAIAPEVLAACIAGHRSAEPGHVAALNKLGLRPLVDLDLRLGEGTGALLALPLVQSTARAMHEVATFDSAGVTEK